MQGQLRAMLYPALRQGAKTCSSCGRKTESLPSRCHVTALPEVMPVSIPRQGLEGMKIQTGIRVDPTVLMEYSDKNGESVFASYELYATICHSGSTIDNGHYFAQVLQNGDNANPTWLTCNDSNVTHTTDGEWRFARKNSAMVFYRLKLPSPPLV